jgi:hypothetical protein
VIGQAIDLRRFFIHQFAPLLYQILHAAGGFVVRR